jgi:YrbI family 3-deoxy-D-manno-octulosonate 8-phosphate phosphatase
MEQKQRRVVAFIPLRGGSKTIPLKNIKEIAGRPLAYWVLDATCGCDLIDKVYVSTDSERIRSIIKDYGSEKIEVIGRSRETATDTAKTESAMLEFAGNIDFSDVVLVQATSPLTEAFHLKDGIKKYFNTRAESLVSVVRQKRFIWEKDEDDSIKPINYDPPKRPRRQDWSGYLVENGAFYITSREGLLKSSSRISGRTVCYEMPEETYVELDEPSDWQIVEMLLVNRKSGRLSSTLKSRLKGIKLLVMDVDGVMTDAGMYYGEGGEELKKFNTRDGKGIEIVRNMGIKTAFITSERTLLVERRAKKLKIDLLFQGVSDKAEILKKLIKDSNIVPGDVAYIGDDINDMDAMKVAGFLATPADGIRENKVIATYVCKTKGGQGCVREVCDLLIEAKKT